MERSSEDQSLLKTSLKTQESQESLGSDKCVPRRCVCSWEGCRAFQLGFHHHSHPLFDGVIKLRFLDDNHKSLAFKESIDRTLRVPENKANNWKTKNKIKRSEQGDPNASSQRKVLHYHIARHHFSALHMKRYLAKPEGYSFFSPFSKAGAKKYLYYLDEKDIFSNEIGVGPLYFQCPNVPLDIVKAEFNTFVKGMEERSDIIGKDVAQENVSVNTVLTDTRQESEVSTTNSDSTKKVITKFDSMTVSATQTATQLHLLLQNKEDENLKLRKENKTLNNKVAKLHQSNMRLEDEVELINSHLLLLNDMVRQLQETPRTGDTTANNVKSGRSCSNPSVLSMSKSGHCNRFSESINSFGRIIPQEIDFDENVYDILNEDNDDDSSHVNSFLHRRSSCRYSAGTHTSRGSRSLASLSEVVKMLPREVMFDDDDDDEHSGSSNEEKAIELNPNSTVQSNSYRYKRYRPVDIFAGGISSNGAVYEGGFCGGKFSGPGRIQWNGGWYEGEWLENCQHGQGREVRSDGFIRGGAWFNGQQNHQMTTVQW